MNVLALIPAYNESAHIQGVVQAARRHLPVLVVDDGSKDDTARLAEEAGASVLRQSPNQGKGAALRAGMRRALEEGRDAILTLDADGQHDPREIPPFLRLLEEKSADLVIGQRDFSRMPPVRRASNTLGTWLFSRALWHPVPDNQSGYRLISRRLMQACLESREQGFEFEVEMLVICARQGMRLEWTPIRTIYGDEKSHIRPLHHAWHFLRMVWQTYRRVRS